MSERAYAETGHEEIDVDHLVLDQLFSRLAASAEAGRALEAETLLRAVIEQLGAHFAHEQRLMRDSDYPLAKVHGEAHRLHLAEVGRMFRELAGTGLADAFRRWIRGRLLPWLRFHVYAHDVALAQYLAEREQAHPRLPRSAG